MNVETIPTPLPRIAQFENLGYGLFLHWGLYSQLDRGEWIQYQAKIPGSKYAELANSFTAADFDARALARQARECGMRYITITTRHHDGFSLYDTRGLSSFDAPHSAAGRDLVAEFVEGCRAEGIVPFFYHTTLDWTWDSANCDDAKFDDYLNYLNASVEVLCRHYGEIGGLWFDGNWSRKVNWKEDRLYATIRRYQPEAIIVNNTGLEARGATGNPEIDSTTFEQGLPTAPDRRGRPKYLAGEMCETLNHHWGIASQDFNYKSPAEIIRQLCACRKVGANYLLNVGPTAGGALPAYEAALLRKVGGWITLTGDLLYRARPYPGAICQGADFVLEADGRLYYFAHHMARRGSAHVVAQTSGNGPRSIQGLPQTVNGCRWLDNGEAIPFSQAADRSFLTLDLQGYDYGSDFVVRVAEIS